jgi:hypothetical protein
MRKLWLAALLLVIALPVLIQASVITFGGTSLCGDSCAGNVVQTAMATPTSFGVARSTLMATFPMMRTTGTRTEPRPAPSRITPLAIPRSH